MNRIDERHLLASSRSKSYKRRAKNLIRHIAIHHSSTTSGNAEAFARYYVNELGWSGIGYHYVIDKDGSISRCHDLEVVSYHVGNSNSFAVGICMVGDFRTQTLASAQREATVKLTRSLMNELTISVENVWGHTEFPGYSWKSCPSISMYSFRNWIKDIRTHSKLSVISNKERQYR